MIYKKDANFPYPILRNGTTSYKDSEFLFDTFLVEDENKYKFTYKYKISASFINNMIEKNEAKLVLVVQSKDSKAFELKKNQDSISIAKKHLSIDGRTSLQMHTVTKKQISFKNNNNLNEFYEVFKENIVLPKYSTLGFSNIVTLEGRMRRPLNLFDKKLDENLSSEIKIELGSETIIIYFKDPSFQFNESNNKSFRNPYIYLGLHVALTKFIENYSEEGEENVVLSDIHAPENILDYKLYQLMESRMVEELNKDNIDEVISSMSDQIIGKYVYAVKELTDDRS